MRRLWLLILLDVFLAATGYASFLRKFDSANPSLPLAEMASNILLWIGTALGVVATIDQLWDRYGSQRKRPERAAIPDEKVYLIGRLKDFQLGGDEGDRKEQT